jgi:hypothetical protein
VNDTRARPCPHCGAHVAPCAEPVEELGPGAICGSWGCAQADHLLHRCTAPEGEAYRQRIARKGELRAIDAEVDARIAEIASYPPGWLDGEGLELHDAPWVTHALKALIRWCDLPLPHLYPTPEGGAQAEWSLGGCLEVSVTLSPQAREAEAQIVDVQIPDDGDAERDWATLRRVVREQRLASLGYEPVPDEQRRANIDALEFDRGQP